LYGWVRSIRLQTTDTVPNVSENTKHKGECLLNIAHIVVLPDAILGNCSIGGWRCACDWPQMRGG
jgi:hypothetical protein